MLSHMLEYLRQRKLFECSLIPILYQREYIVFLLPAPSYDNPLVMPTTLAAHSLILTSQAPYQIPPLYDVTM